MTYDIFKDEKEKADARRDLTALMDMPGWKLVQRAIELNVKHFEGQLREKPFASLEELEYHRDRISDLESLQQLPSLLIAAAEPENEEEPEEDLYPEK